MVPETQLANFTLFIDGRSIESESRREFDSEDPYAGRPWARVADGTPADVDTAVAAARRAFEGEWGAATGFERAAVMRACADAIGSHAEELALLEVRDSGKLLREMRGQMGFLASWFHYFAGLADKLEGRTVPAANPNFFCYTRREPVGVVGCITPWNSPLLLLTWKLAPLLAAGNTCVVKPSEHAPASTVEFARILHAAGLPAGVMNVVTALGPRHGRGAGGAPGDRQGGVHRVDRDRGQGGAGGGQPTSTASRSSSAARAPHVVFPDADLDAVANGLIAGVFAATGQTCMAGSPTDRARARCTTRSSSGGRAGERHRARRPDRAGDRDGPGRQPAAVREGARLPRGGARRGGATFACGGEPDASAAGCSSARRW